MTAPQNTTSGLPEQQEQSTQRFSIDLLPIENQEDKFSYISNLSIISNITIEQMRTLGLTLDNANDVDKSTFTGYKTLKLNLDKNGYNTNNWIGKDIFKNIGVSLFQAKETDVVGQHIIISTTDDMKFIGKIEEYLANGIGSLSKKNDGEIQQTINQAKQQETYFLQGALLNIKTPKQLLNIGADDYCITDKENHQFCVLKDNTIKICEYTDDAIIPISDIYDLSNYGTIKNIRTDINNNFYFIITEKEGKSELKVLNRKTLEDVMSFPDLTEIVYLSDEQGKLFCMDKEGYLRLITVNTKQLPRGYVDTNKISAETTKNTIVKIEDKSRKDLEEAMKNRLTLNLTDEPPENTTADHSDDEALRKKLWNTPIQSKEQEPDSEGEQEKAPTLTFKQLFTQAETLSEINQVYALAQQLKTNPKILAVKGLIDPILQQISEKREKIRLKTISQTLQEIVAELPHLSDFSDMILLKNKLSTIKKERSQIIIADKDLDTLIKETLKTIKEKITEYQSAHQEEIQKHIEENIALIQDYMQNIDYMVQITSVYSTELRKQTKEFLNYLPETQQKTLDDTLTNIVKKRQNELRALAQKEAKGQQEQQQKQIAKIQNQINEIKTIVASINEEDTLEQIEKNDPLVAQTRNDIDSLPPQKAQELSIKLDQVFKERLLSIKFAKEETKGGLGALDQYGIPKSLYFVPEIQKKVKREVFGKPLNDGKYKLQFRSSVGNIIEPSINKKILGKYQFTYTHDERIKLKEQIGERNTNGIRKKYQELIQKEEKSEAELQEITTIEKDYYIPRMLEVMNKITGEGKMRDIHQRTHLPHIDPKTTITPTVQERLSERGQVLNQQLVNKQGYMLIESDAGTGKNFKIDILGHLTNREVFDISCNSHMEKEDLLFSPEINTEGTFRTPSALIRGIQTPGAIILLDEVNTLKPGVAKLLNPLLDGRRYINDPQKGKIKVHPSVIIIGAMNPRDYLGTNPIPQEQISRARIVNDSYQPVDEEAFMISKHLDNAVSQLSFEEFKKYWGEYIERNEKPNNKTLYNTFIAFQKVVELAKQMREEFSKTRRGKSEIGQEMDWLFTPRESIQIIQDYNFTKDIKKSIENVVLPKIADLEQREYAKTLIEKKVK